MSHLTDVGQAIVQSINAAVFPPHASVPAELRRVVAFDPEELTELTVSVVPITREISRLDRGGRWVWLLSCDVAVQQRVDPHDAAQIEELICLTEAIDEHLRKQERLLWGEARYWGSSLLTPADPEHLDTTHVLTSVFRVTYRMVA